MSADVEFGSHTSLGFMPAVPWVSLSQSAISGESDPPRLCPVVVMVSGDFAAATCFARNGLSASPAPGMPEQGISVWQMIRPRGDETEMAGLGGGGSQGH